MNKCITSVVLALLMSACATTQTATTPQKSWATLIKKDANLYQVDDKLYRSEQPIEDDQQTIAKAGITTIVNLRYFDRNDNQAIFDDKMNLISQPLLTWRVRPSDIATILHTIKREQKQGPVLVHCYHGADRTGIVIAMYRVIHQGWDIEAARSEMKQGGYGHHKIWKNLDRLLSPSGVEQVKAELNKLK